MKGKNFKSIKLSKSEQKIIYILEEANGPVTYSDITKKVNLPEDIISYHVSNMIQKGIPIIKEYMANDICLKLNSHFK